jgi:L-threonylcarbamoyladenylate synthase
MIEVYPISDAGIATAITRLRAGDLVAFPTETVYGLGADATNASAVAQIFAAKQRPEFNPLISHVASPDAAFELGTENPIATSLANAFWPGPLTLVLKRKAQCPVALLATAGLDKIGLRVPAHKGAQLLLRAFGKPLAAPSANPSGQISPSTADHVVHGLGENARFVLDGGPCESGLESTIIDCTDRTACLLRPGGITREAVATALRKAGLDPTITIAKPLNDRTKPIAPGQLTSHYAPRATLRVAAETWQRGEEMIGFGKIHGVGKLRLNLSPSGNLIEAAANLFSMLHAADATSTEKIAIAPIPNTGLGEAINDRLHRAAAPRPD